MMSKCRILYIGQTWRGGTCNHRKQALIDLGHEIIEFDTSEYTKHSNKIVMSLAHRWNRGMPVSNLNRDLCDFVSKGIGKFDYVWVDKGKWIYPETLNVLKSSTHGKLIHYTPDAQIVINKSRFFKQSLDVYDVLFTTKPFELNLYREMGAKNIHLVNQSYDRRILKPINLSSKQIQVYGSDVGFIGHCQKHYAAKLKTITTISGNVKVWGPGWKKYKRYNNWVNSIFNGDGVWEGDYAIAINAADIGLCLLSKSIPETTTTRTFEIPACRTFMLAERTDEHLSFFEEGKEAEFFSTDEELKEKIKFYLKNEDTRHKIAKAGYQRCIRSGYDNHSEMQKILTITADSVVHGGLQ
jgi:glycosyltransferase involved in cell wall biosynthesis